MVFVAQVQEDRIVENYQGVVDVDGFFLYCRFQIPRLAFVDVGLSTDCFWPVCLVPSAVIDDAYLCEQCLVAFEEINKFKSCGEKVLIPGSVFRELSVKICLFRYLRTFVFEPEAVEGSVLP